MHAGKLFSPWVQRPRVYAIYAPPSDRNKTPCAAASANKPAKGAKGGFLFFFADSFTMVSIITTSLPRPSSSVYFREPRYERPSSAKLSGVKFDLYNPQLPTLRRMDMDSMAHKLSSEHSRTTTTCSRGSQLNTSRSMRRVTAQLQLHACVQLSP